MCPGGQGLLPDFQLPAPSGPAGRAAHTGWPMKELLVFQMEWEKSEASVRKLSKSQNVCQNCINEGGKESSSDAFT